MFENLTQKINSAFKHLSGNATLSDKHINASLHEIKTALIDADVAFDVVETFSQSVQDKALGQKVIEQVKPADMLVKIVHDELLAILNTQDDRTLNCRSKPAIILLAGLQGAGKTTMAAKLAKYIKEQLKKSVSMVSTDIYRAAAIEQLATLGQQNQIDVIPSTTQQNPLDIVNNAIQTAKNQLTDVIIIDTAGRTHIDAQMMQEITAIQQASMPTEVLFVVDGMTGQDAAQSAKAFHHHLKLTGVILTKTDGDSRGGAALSVKSITGVPIKFMGTGEKVSDIDTFDPERIAQQILGMGDIVSLVRQMEQGMDRKKTEKLATKIAQGGEFNFHDLALQLDQMEASGGMEQLVSKLPGSFQLPQDMLQSGMKNSQKIRYVIQSMTQQEKTYTDLVNIPRRKRRIAHGSGTDIVTVNQAIKQLNQMRKMMRKFKSGKMQKMMQQVSGMMGNDFSLEQLLGQNKKEKE